MICALKRHIQDMEYVKTIIYLEDLLIMKNISFKDHLIKLKVVPERQKLLNADIRVNIS
jgi:hypothetical protein